MLPAVTGLVTILLSWAARCSTELVTFWYVIYSSAFGGQIERTWKVDGSCLLTSRIYNGFFNNLVHVLSKQCGVSVSVNPFNCWVFFSRQVLTVETRVAHCLLYVHNNLKFKKIPLPHSPMFQDYKHVTSYLASIWISCQFYLVLALYRSLLQ